jgi:hypothetical protein
MLSGPSAFVLVADNLLVAVRARLAENGVDIPNRIAVVPSPIVADDCQCGLLAVAVPRIYGSDTPLQDPSGGAVPAGPGAGSPYPADEIPSFLNGELQVAIMRCADIPPDGTPSAETLAAEAVQVHADAYWVQVAVSCELARLKAVREIDDYALGDQPFIPNQGGCQGGQYNVTVAVPAECPCP